MFINARPRPDLNGFRSFVPSRIVELSYYWPNSMTNHGTNTWSNLMPATSSAAAPGAWAYRSDLTSNAEGYSNFFSESCEAASGYTQARVRSKSILAAPIMIEYPQLQSTNIMQLEAQSPYDLQEAQLPRLESGRQHVGANSDSYGWNMGSPAANYSKFSRGQHPSNRYSYSGQLGLEIDDASSIPPAASGPSLYSLYDTPPVGANFGSNVSESETVYTSSFDQAVGTSHALAVSSRAPAAQNSFSDRKPWYEVSGNSKSGDPCGITLPFSYDGLPNTPPALWSMQSGQSLTWSQQTSPPGTISPQALSLVAPASSTIPGDISPRSSSGWHSETSVTSQPFQESAVDVRHPLIKDPQGPGSGMSHARVRSRKFQIQSSRSGLPGSNMRPQTPQGAQTARPRGDKAGGAGHSILSDEFEPQESAGDRQYPTTPSKMAKLISDDRPTGDLASLDVGFIKPKVFQTKKSVGAVQQSTRRVLRPRRKLPSGRMNKSFVSPPSGNVGILSRSHKGVVMMSSRIPDSNSDDPSSPLSTARQYTRKVSGMQQALGLDKNETKITKEQLSGSLVETKHPAVVPERGDAAQQRVTKDKFLLDSKRDGKSYKQIRLEGGFTEAESTLRGRHRALTKKPEDRVRKPEWDSNDLRLLKQAVHKLAGDPSLPRPKRVSWKEVSDFIVENGGSYRFGNSTCRKKWTEVYAISGDQDLS